MHINTVNTKQTHTHVSVDDLTYCLYLFLVVVLIHLVLELFASATCEDRSYEVKARSRNAALGSYAEVAAIVGTQTRIPEQEIGSLETGVGKKHEADEDVDKVKELFAITEDAGKERDDPGTESDKGICDGDALDSGQRAFIWN